jgi:hypothetical protein
MWSSQPHQANADKSTLNWVATSSFQIISLSLFITPPIICYTVKLLRASKNKPQIKINASETNRHQEIESYQEYCCKTLVLQIEVYSFTPVYFSLPIFKPFSHSDDDLLG